jgi:hypothetical protein
MAINQRIFGTPISGKVRKELEKRQQQEGEITFGSSLEGGGLTAEGSKLTQYNEVHSRTPFVRMWTSLKLIDPEVVKEAQKRIISKEEIAAEYNGSVQEAMKSLRKKAEDGYGVDYVTPEVYEPTPPDGSVIVKEKGARDKIDFARKIYVVGNQNYQDSYSSNNVNDSLDTEDPSFSSKSYNFDDVDESGVLGAIFRQELKKNKLLKPQAGITSLNVQSMGAVGAVKQTTVNFVVHNFHDFDDIYQKYFLKPGATIFVDYGWNTVENLYQPKKLIESVNSPGGIQQFLYGSTEDGDDFDGEITKYESQLDVIQGLVSDYNAKILPNGSVECSVTLLSANTAILGTEGGDDLVDNIKTILTKGILYYGVTDYIKDRFGEGSDELIQIYNSPNYDTSVTSQDAFDQKVEERAISQFSSDTLPTRRAIKSGLYINSLNKSDVYISWGLFEDLIINTQFGFGKDRNEINRGDNFQVRMDSSQSFTKWSEKKVDSQKAQLKDNQEQNPLWLYPEWWGGNGDISGDYGVYREADSNPDFTSYSYREGKVPIRREGVDEEGESFYFDDLINNRIPLREIFIHTKTIIDTIEQNWNESVTKIIRIILKKLNDASAGLFDWQLKGGQVDSQLQVVDAKYIDKTLRNKYEDDSTGEADKLFFKFNIMSKASFVKDYNLELKVGSGELANYYMLQALSHDGALIKVKKDLAGALNSIYGLEANQLSIIYEPDNGGYRAEQSAQENRRSDGFNVYNTMKDLIGREPVQQTFNEYVAPDNDDRVGITAADVLYAAPEIDSQLIERITDRNEEIEKVLGVSHAMSFQDFFDGIVYEEVVEPEQSTLLPYFLTLTIYGISSLQIGDTFQVDYLPREHLKNSYLQTIGVTQNIDSSGWYTTLETMYKPHFLKPSAIEDVAETPVNKLDIRLSPRVMTNRGLINGEFYLYEGRVYNNERALREYQTDNFTTKYLQAFMTNITVKNNFWKEFSGPFRGSYLKRDLPGHIVKFKTPGASNDNPDLFKEAELNKINGIMFQSLYAECGYIDPDDKKAKIQMDGDLFANSFKWTKNSSLLNLGGAYKLLGGYATALKDPHIEDCTTNPFMFCDPKYYYKRIKRKPYTDFPKKTNKPDDYNFQTRVYPPAVEFKPNENYTMIVMNDNRYAIFQDNLFTNKDLNLLIKTFTTVGTDVKSGPTNTTPTIQYDDLDDF